MSGPRRSRVSEATAARGMALAMASAGLALMVLAVAMVWLPAAVFLAGAGLMAFGVLGLRGLRRAPARSAHRQIES